MVLGGFRFCHPPHLLSVPYEAVIFVFFETPFIEIKASTLHILIEFADTNLDDCHNFGDSFSVWSLASMERRNKTRISIVSI